MTSAALALLWAILNLAPVGWMDVVQVVPVVTVEQSSLRRWHPQAIAAAYSDRIEATAEALQRPEIARHEYCHWADVQDGKADGRFFGVLPSGAETMPWEHDDDVERLGSWCEQGGK